LITYDSKSPRGRASNGRPVAVDRAPETPTPPGPVDKLLRLPLFYKILVANAVILAVAVLIGGLLLARLGGISATEAAKWASIIGASAVVVGAACSAFLTRLALRPLTELEVSAERVERGDLQTRAAMSSLADTDMRRLVTLFNRMLDRIELYRSRQREVTVRSLESEENARRWVARKLYDETAQSLAAVLLQLRAAGRRFGDAEQGQFDNLRKALIEALESIREVARELRPPELDEIGLVPALAAQVRNLSERSGVDIHLDADSIESDLTTEESLALYRIVSEALGNAARHAGARSVDVRIVRGPDGVSAEIHDNGAGFDVDSELERAGRGLGLLEMRERALHVGAELSIQSSEVEGTTVSVNMPFGTER
jgi:two-component system sensor histidine kinase UhpB